MALDLAWQGAIEAEAGRLAEAERDCRQAVVLVGEQKGGAPINVGNIRLLTGGVLAETGRLEEADDELAQALAIFRKESRSGILLGRALDTIGDVARRRGQIERAVAAGREALAALEKEGGAEHPSASVARVHLGAALWTAGDAAGGERMLRSGLGSLERLFPNGHCDLASARFLLGEALAQDGRVAEARPLLRQALDWRQAHLGSADPRTAAARRALDLGAGPRERPSQSTK